MRISKISYGQTSPLDVLMYAFGIQFNRSATFSVRKKEVSIKCADRRSYICNVDNSYREGIRKRPSQSECIRKRFFIILMFMGKQFNLRQRAFQQEMPFVSPRT